MVLRCFTSFRRVSICEEDELLNFQNMLATSVMNDRNVKITRSSRHVDHELTDIQCKIPFSTHPHRDSDNLTKSL